MINLYLDLRLIISFIIGLNSIYLFAQSNSNYLTNQNGFCSHLPIVVVQLSKPFPLVTNDKQATKAKVPVTLLIYDKNITIDTAKTMKNCLSDEPLKLQATMHYRGSSSLTSPKHQFSVKLVTEPTAPFLHMPAKGKSWVFGAELANLDGTFLRSSYSFHLQNELGKELGIFTWAPRTKFFELFIQNPSQPLDINDDYTGLYILKESIGFGKNRIEPLNSLAALLYKIDDTSKAALDDELVDNGFGGQVYVDDTYKIDISQMKFTANDDLWERAFSLWTYYLNLDPNNNTVKIIDGVYTSFSTDNKSFALYFILNELMKDPDGYNKSTYLYQTYQETVDPSNQKQGKVITYAGPLWDKNLAYDLHLTPVEDFNGTGGFAGYGPPYAGADGWSFTNKSPYWKQLLRNKELQKEICSIWVAGRNEKHILADTNIMSYIDQQVDWLKAPNNKDNEPIARDCNKYFPDTDCAKDYEKKVQMMKDYIALRVKWLEDKGFGTDEASCITNFKQNVLGE